MSIEYIKQLEDENIELTKQDEKLKETCDRLTADLMSDKEPFETLKLTCWYLLLALCFGFILYRLALWWFS